MNMNNFTFPTMTFGEFELYYGDKLKIVDKIALMFGHKTRNFLKCYKKHCAAVAWLNHDLAKYYNGEIQFEEIECFTKGDGLITEKVLNGNFTPGILHVLIENIYAYGEFLVDVYENSIIEDRGLENLEQDEFGLLTKTKGVGSQTEPEAVFAQFHHQNEARVLH